jgi:hypothetical protein
VPGPATDQETERPSSFLAALNKPELTNEVPSEKRPGNFA